MISSLMVMAAASAAQLPASLEHDMRCLAALAVVTGSSEDTNFHAETTKAAYYFMGKISQQDPNLDIGPHLRRILLAPGFGREYKSESAACLAEVEAGRRKMAKAREALSDDR